MFIRISFDAHEFVTTYLASKIQAGGRQLPAATQLLHMSSWSDSFVNALYWWTVLLSLMCGVVIFLTGKEKDARSDKSSRETEFKLAELQTKASDALAEQQRVQIELARAQKELIETKQLAATVDTRTADRVITSEQRIAFIDYLKTAKKRPVQVIVYSNRQEPMNYARQIRECLDTAGFADPIHPYATILIGPSLYTPDNAHVAVSYYSVEELRADFDASYNYHNIVNAFRTIGVHVGNIVERALGEKPGEMKIVVADK